MRNLAARIGCVALGCGMAAALFWRLGMWCFAVLLLIVLAALAVIAYPESATGWPNVEDRSKTAA